MGNNIIKSLAAGLVGAALIATLGWLLLPTGMLPRELASAHPDLPSGWFHLAHTFHNSFFSWSYPTGFGFLLDDLAMPLQDSLPIVLSIYTALLWVGLMALLVSRKSYSIPASFFLAGLILLALVFWVGFDLTIVATICLVPYLILLLQNSKSSILLQSLLCLLIGILAFQIANQLAILSLLFGSLGFFALKKPEHSTAQTGMSILLILIPIAYGLAISPFAVWPDYPDTALLVSPTGLPGYIHPTFAPSFPIPVIERAALKLIYFTPALYFAALGLILWVSSFKRPQHRSAGILLFIMMLLLVLGCIADEEIAQISPLLSGQRVIPHLFYFAIEPILFGAALLLPMLLLLCGKHTRIFGLCWLAFVVFFVYHQPLTKELRFFPNREQVISYFLSAPSNQQKLIASPSLATLQEQGVWPIPGGSRVKETRFTLGRRVEFTVTASHQFPFAPISNMLDQDRTTRWAVSGGQKGGEWVAFSFPRAKTISGVSIQPGAFYTDYPRGLDIYAMDDCDTPPSVDKRPFLSFPKWHGELGVTPDGYPYHLGFNQVRIVFPQDVTTSCLYLVQTGKSKFDWSITRVAFAFPEGRRDQ